MFRHAIRTVAIALAGAGLVVGVAACSSDSATPGASESASSGASTAASAPAVGGQNDPAGLVQAMWDALDPSSQKQLCDIHAQQGDKAALIFVAGTQSDPQADILSDNDKASIANAGAVLLKKVCV